jgi:[protein-PII] uridylyltransferase
LFASGPERWATTPFSQRRRSLIEDEARQGPAFSLAYAQLVDDWLADLLTVDDDVALVALGGYGRQELCPFSDLDLLLLHRGRPDIGQLAESLWYPIWDERVSLDHSVRTVREAVRTAENDVRTALTMLDARFVAGDASLVDELVERLDRSLTKLARRWLRTLDEATEERHRRAGDVAFLLEPDVKESKGGLRDAGVLGAVGRLLQFVTPEPATRAARDALLTVRIELHRTVGRPLDSLLLQDQDEVGRRLQRRDGRGAGLDGDGDELMAVVAAAGRRISWATDDAWRRIRAWIDGPRRARSGAGARDLGRGVVRVDDEIALVAGDGDGDAVSTLHAAAEAARQRLPFARDTLERLAAPTTALPDPWPPSVREEFLALLGSGPGLVAVFETLDHTGVWRWLIPEWAPVESRPQRNAFHRFTVDRHLVEAVVQAAVLAPSVARPDLLLVAALFHDLGKGYPGDHTDAGVILIDGIGARIGFPAGDVATLRTLVRLHLLLPDTATRRDLDDPKTIDIVAAEVSTLTTLELLAALTEADARATGPTAWTSWRSGLVRALVERVGERLTSGTRATSPPPEPVRADAATDAGTTVVGNGLKATVTAEDRRGLFCAVAGVMALHGLDILGATAIGREPRWDLVQRDLRAVLEGRLPLDEQLARRQETYGDRHVQRAARPAAVDVQFLDHVSDASTVVDVRGPASLGTLYRITRRFAELDLDIRHARVTTIGNQAVDSFYLVDRDGRPLTDPDLRHRLGDAIMHDLSAP